MVIIQLPIDEYIDVKLKVDVGFGRLGRRGRVVGCRRGRHRRRGIDRPQLDRGETQLLGVAGKVGVTVVPKN